MMDSIAIRPIREDEFPDVLRVASVAFGEEYSEDDGKTCGQAFPFERSLAAFDNGKMVATSGILSLEITLPGNVAVPMGGVTWIATLPTHRRRGLLRRLMTGLFADMVERGEMISALGASEANIYGRFGYAPATHFTSFSVERPYATFASPVDHANTGRITLLDSGEAAAQLPAIYEKCRLGQPGAVTRPPSWWSEHLHDPSYKRQGAGGMFHCKHETAPGTADGYVSYRIKEDWAGVTPANEVRLVELVAGDPRVYRALWDYLLGTDLSQKLTCWRGRVNEPLRWLLADPRRFKVDAQADFLWLRLLDVPRALAARAYGSAGELVFEVTDTFPTPTTSRYALRAEPATAAGTGPATAPNAECARTTSAPDLALEIDALAAAYLGGVTFATLAAAGRVRELRAGAIARADALFRADSAPFCMTEF
jgi:predicted acetyltransferase